MKKLINNIRSRAQRTHIRAGRLIHDRRGDLATNTIGAIIVAVVIVGLLVLAVKTFFPDFFSDMFATMQSKMEALW